MRELSSHEIERVSGGITDSTTGVLLDSLLKDALKWVANAAGNSAVGIGLQNFLNSNDTGTAIIINTNSANSVFNIGGVDYEEIWTDSNGTTGYYDADTGTLQWDYDGDLRADAVQIGDGNGGFSGIILPD